jgi:hypothetical protein
MTEIKALFTLIAKATINGAIIALWGIALRYYFKPPILTYMALVTFPIIIILIFRYVWGFKFSKKSHRKK